MRHLGGLAQKLYDKHLSERSKEEIDLNKKENQLLKKLLTNVKGNHKKTLGRRRTKQEKKQMSAAERYYQKQVPEYR